MARQCCQMTSEFTGHWWHHEPEPRLPILLCTLLFTYNWPPQNKNTNSAMRIYQWSNQPLTSALPFKFGNKKRRKYFYCDYCSINSANFDVKINTIYLCLVHQFHTFLIKFAKVRKTLRSKNVSNTTLQFQLNVVISNEIIFC